VNVSESKSLAFYQFLQCWGYAHFHPPLENVSEGTSFLESNGNKYRAPFTEMTIQKHPLPSPQSKVFISSLKNYANWL